MTAPKRPDTSKWPWPDIEPAAKEILDTGKWTAWWDLEKAHPKLFGGYSEIHDRYLVPLSNSGTVRTTLRPDLRLAMLLSLVRHPQGRVQNATRSEQDGARVGLRTLRERGFREWYNTARIALWRGVPADGAKAPPPKPEALRSYSLIRDYAVKFTDPMWLAGEFAPSESDRDGWLLECWITPAQLYLYDDAGWEAEVVPDTEPTLVRAHRVAQGHPA